MMFKYNVSKALVVYRILIHGVISLPDATSYDKCKLSYGLCVCRYVMKIIHEL